MCVCSLRLLECKCGTFATSVLCCLYIFLCKCCCQNDHFCYTSCCCHIWDLVSQRRNYIGDYCSAVGRVKNVFFVAVTFSGQKERTGVELIVKMNDGVICLFVFWKVGETASVVTSIDDHSRASLGVAHSRCNSVVGSQHAVLLESTGIFLRSLPRLVPTGLRFAASCSGASLPTSDFIS